MGDVTDRTGQKLTLAEHWHDSRWIIPRMPDTSIGGALEVVCFGDDLHRRRHSARRRNVISPNAWRYAGRTMAERHLEHPESSDTRAIGPGVASFSAVSCAATTDCMAVGSVPGSERTFAESWGGSEWAVTNTPAVPDGSTMNGVTCVSATACLAVGSSQNAEWWNGERWSETSGGGGTSVSCASQSRCVSVDGAQQTTQLWDGSRWTVESTPPLTQSGGYSLNGVSCSSSTFCLAVGSYNADYEDANGVVPLKPLALVLDGTRWSFQSIPAPGGATANVLNGISCTSATACTAVGAYTLTGSRPNLPLNEAWDGSNWTIEDAPTRPARRQAF